MLAIPQTFSQSSEASLHQYSELVYRTAVFTLKALREADERTREGMGTTIAVKNLQATRLQKAITAIGMFSLFESVLQGALNCKDGFVEARRCMKLQEQSAMAERFSLFFAAVNVLKHGQGASYDSLLRSGHLPFRIERPNAPLFVEGDATGIAMLVDADDQFVLDCAQIIRDVSGVVRLVHPDSWL